jgi:general secretion pathway protein F
MPQFRYEVKKGTGDAASGVLDAENQRAAVARLRDMGYFPTLVEAYNGDEEQDSFKRALTRIKLKDRNIFFRQLANLTEAGMPITRALSTLTEQTENTKMVKVIEALREDVQQGTTFAEALERHPKVFSPIQCNLVHAGESGGMLNDVLWRLVDFGEQEEELKGKAISALIYPIFLMLLGSASIFILMSFVFPKFILIFEDFNASLPWPTRVVMGVCAFMESFWWAVLIGVAALGAGIFYWIRSESGKRQFHTHLLSLPIVGDLALKYEMATFARTLGTLLDNGVPILTSLRITSETLGNVAVASEVASIQGRVAEGEGLSDSLGTLPYFPPMVVNMFAVGEESGRIGAVSKRIADAYDTEVDRAVKAMTALLEPILIVVMGIVIGFLVIAMLMPMLTLSSNVG